MTEDEELAMALAMSANSAQPSFTAPSPTPPSGEASASASAAPASPKMAAATEPSVPSKPKETEALQPSSAAPEDTQPPKKVFILDHLLKVPVLADACAVLTPEKFVGTLPYLFLLAAWKMDPCEDLVRPHLHSKYFMLTCNFLLCC